MPVTSWSTTPALNTLDSGTAGSGGTITLDGAIQKPSDVDGVQRSHMAQLATFNNAPTFGTGITFTNSAFTIAPNTSDGSDNAAVWLAGGGAATTARGAMVIVYGNEGLSPGNIRLIPGTTAATGVSVEGAMTVTGALTISGAGAGQIVFPASQNASANANTFDDYEEGTYTPGVTFGGASVGLTYSSRTGTYTKLGNTVHCSFDITLSAKGSSVGSMNVSLPFTVSTAFTSLSVGFYNTFTGLTGALCGVATASTGLASIYQMGAASTAAVTDAAVTNASRIVASTTFFV
jgi:hypothetical protein